MTTTTRDLTLRDAVRYLVLGNPDITNAQIQQRLGWLGFECSSFVVSSIRGSLRDHLRFLRRVGLLGNKQPLIPSCIRNLRPPRGKEFERYD